MIDSAAPAAVRPFPGLRPFATNERPLFFGREGQSAEIIRRLLQRNFVMVIGTSGSGKSSLVRAGVVPMLESGQGDPARIFRVATMSPGEHPVRSLAHALTAASLVPPSEAPEGLTSQFVETTLRRSSQGLKEAVRQAQLPPRTAVVVFVDQFEEIFRIHDPSRSDAGSESQAFVRLLLEAVAHAEYSILVIATMRSEYLGQCSRYFGLPEAINAGEYLIPRMTREQRKHAILGPLKLTDAVASPPLIQRLLNDTGDEPDHLPELQHVLARTWDVACESAGQQVHEITLDNYRRVGAIEEALTRHADEAFAELSSSEQGTAEWMFRALTSAASNTPEKRRPLPLSRLVAITRAPQATLVKIIEVFRRRDRSFLTPSVDANPTLDNDPVIDISHESLIRLWDRLSGWARSEAEDARLYRRVSDWAQLHAGGKATLWDGPNLALARRWLKARQPNAAWASLYDGNLDEVTSFIRKSVRRKRWRFAIAVMIAVAITSFAAWFFVQQKEEALQRAAGAREREGLKKQAQLESQLRKVTEELNRSLTGQNALLENEKQGRKQAQAMVEQATALANQHRASDAASKLDEAIESYASVGLKRESVATRLQLVALYAFNGRWSEAEAGLAKAENEASDLTESRLMGQTHELGGLLAEARGAADRRGTNPSRLLAEASRRYAAAEKLFADTGAEQDRARIKERQASLAESAPDPSRAIALYVAAEAAYRRGNDRLAADRAAKMRERLEDWGYLADLSNGSIYRLTSRQSDPVLGRQGSIKLGEMDSRVSREHAALRHREGDTVLIADLRSTNGTTVNADFLHYGAPRPVEDGDVIVLAGARSFQFFHRRPKPGIGPPPGAWALLILCVPSWDRKADCVPSTRYLTSDVADVVIDHRDRTGSTKTDVAVTLKKADGSDAVWIDVKDASWLVSSGVKKNDYDYDYMLYDHTKEAFPLSFNGAFAETEKDAAGELRRGEDGRIAPKRMVYFQLVKIP